METRYVVWLTVTLAVFAATLGCSSSGGSGAGTAGAAARPQDPAGAGRAEPARTAGGDGASSTMSFFITSDKSMTGNLGGLDGADQRCQTLAQAAGAGGKTWHAYLSAAMGPGGTPVNAKDRIGNGPWYNVKGALIATNVADLHTKNGDYTLFLTEKGQPVNGQWPTSPAPVEHDLLTGSNRDGTVDPANTCKDWTSASAADQAWVGHTDGLGPKGSTADKSRPWNHTHLNQDCSDTKPRGGAGRIACFAVN